MTDTVSAETKPLSAARRCAAEFMAGFEGDIWTDNPDGLDQTIEGWMPHLLASERPTASEVVSRLLLFAGLGFVVVFIVSLLVSNPLLGGASVFGAVVSFYLNVKLAPARNAKVDIRRRSLAWDVRYIVRAELKSLREAARSDDPAVRRRAQVWEPAGEAPSPEPLGVSHRGAELLCAAWMTYLGEPQVAVTQFTGDGGIDIASRHYVAQVKNYTKAVPIAAVRELHGVAVVDGRKALFFTSGSYPASAVDLADKTGMALFIYDAVAGTIRGHNRIAHRHLERGL